MSEIKIFTLVVVSMRWQDQKRFVGPRVCNTIGNKINSFYRTNSRNKIGFKTKGIVIKVPYNAARKNLNKAEKYCMEQVGKFDYYALINNGVKEYSNAGRNLMHLEGGLIRTAIHECGHCLGLGHAGKYTKKGGKYTYDDYGDGDSVMSRYPSNHLTAPAYWYKKWLYKDEMLELKFNEVQKAELSLRREEVQKYTYELANIKEFGIDDMLKVVKIKREERDCYIAWSGTALCIYLSGEGGGSQLVKKIYDDDAIYKDPFTKLTFSLLKKARDKCSFSVHNEDFEVEDDLSIVSESDIQCFDDGEPGLTY